MQINIHWCIYCSLNDYPGIFSHTNGGRISVKCNARRISKLRKEKSSDNCYKNIDGKSLFANFQLEIVLKYSVRAQPRPTGLLTSWLLIF